MIDSSVNTNQDQFERTKFYIRDIVNGLDIAMDKTRVGMASIANGGENDFFMNEYYNKQRLMFAIEQLRFQNLPTNFADVLRFVFDTMFDLSSGVRWGVPSILVIFVSSQTDISGTAVQQQAQRLKHEKQVTIFTVVIGRVSDEAQLQNDLADLVTSPREHYAFQVDDAGNLHSKWNPTIENPFLKRLCQAIPGILGCSLTRESLTHYLSVKLCLAQQ